MFRRIFILISRTGFWILYLKAPTAVCRLRHTRHSRKRGSERSAAGRPRTGPIIVVGLSIRASRVSRGAFFVFRKRRTLRGRQPGPACLYTQRTTSIGRDRLDSTRGREAGVIATATKRSEVATLSYFTKSPFGANLLSGQTSNNQ